MFKHTNIMKNICATLVLFALALHSSNAVKKIVFQNNSKRGVIEVKYEIAHRKNKTLYFKDTVSINPTEQKTIVLPKELKTPLKIKMITGCKQKQNTTYGGERFYHFNKQKATQNHSIILFFDTYLKSNNKLVAHPTGSELAKNDSLTKQKTQESKIAAKYF